MTTLRCSQLIHNRAKKMNDLPPASTLTIATLKDRDRDSPPTSRLARSERCRLRLGGLPVDALRMERRLPVVAPRFLQSCVWSDSEMEGGGTNLAVSSLTILPTVTPESSKKAGNTGLIEVKRSADMPPRMLPGNGLEKKQCRRHGPPVPQQGTGRHRQPGVRSGRGEVVIKWTGTLAALRFSGLVELCVNQFTSRARVRDATEDRGCYLGASIQVALKRPAVAMRRTASVSLSTTTSSRCNRVRAWPM